MLQVVRLLWKCCRTDVHVCEFIWINWAVFFESIVTIPHLVCAICLYCVSTWHCSTFVQLTVETGLLDIILYSRTIYADTVSHFTDLKINIMMRIVFVFCFAFLSLIMIWLFTDLNVTVVGLVHLCITFQSITMHVTLVFS